MLQLNFSPFPELKTERLLLRKLTMDDAADILFLRSDETVLQFISKEPAASIKEAEAFIKWITDDMDANELIMWGITLKDDPGKVIGSICYWRILKQHYRAEIGYLLHPQYWKKGLMKEAMLKVIEYGFGIMQLHSIEARISPQNIASAAILSATGFVREGYLKEEYFFRGKFFDTAVYSRLLLNK
jgi:[ribosomal protein S5]-alanine N-acetyltransferase